MHSFMTLYDTTFGTFVPSLTCGNNGKEPKVPKVPNDLDSN